MYKAPLSLFLITLPSRHCMTTREDIIEIASLKSARLYPACPQIVSANDELAGAIIKDAID